MKFIYIVFIIISISFAYSLEIGISPSDIYLEAEVNKFICRNFSLTGESGNIFIGDLKWSEKESKNLVDFNLPSEKEKIILTFPNITFSGNNSICFKAEKGGIYYGALLYRVQGSIFGIGAWIKLLVKDNNFDLIGMTGRVIKKEESVGFNLNLILVFIFLLLIFIFIFILNSKISH